MAANLIAPDDNEDRSDRVGLSDASTTNSTEAANLIRDKLARIYAAEPDANQEAREADATPARSKHQQFMYELSNSGKDLATVQTEWHNYYISLPDAEKHQVWQEFYASNSALSTPAATTPTIISHTQPQPVVQAVVVPSTQSAQAFAEHKHATITNERRLPRKPKLRDARSTHEVQKAIRDKVTAGGTLKVKHHLQSLGFGLGLGAVVIIIFLFSFFNEIIIAPFIQPSRVEAATPVIVNSSTVSATATPEVIIPKINVEIPVDYSETSTSESVIESDLEDGIVHYPTTVEPGQIGNTAFFGHSSNNILNSGKYKFAFVLLHTLVNGDTFYLTYQSKLYVYKVISKTIVSPSDVGVLNSVAGQTATATLITCDPPGTSINRLVVVGQQISPDPSGNTAPTVSAATESTVTTLPGNGPTLWTQVMRTTIGKVIFALVILGSIAVTARWLQNPKRHRKQ